MFPSSGLFRDLMCPHESACGRAYCPFWHPPPGSKLERMQSPIDNETATSSAYEGSFYGYNAYIAEAPSASSSIYAPIDMAAAMNSPATAYVPYGGVAANVETEESTKAAVSLYFRPDVKKVKEEPIDEEEVQVIEVKKKKKSIRDLPLPKMKPAKEDNARVNEYVSKVAELTKKIEELERKQKQQEWSRAEGGNSSSKSGESSSRTAKKLAYTPTPLNEIERLKKERREEERKRMEKEGWRLAENKSKTVYDKSETMLIDSLFEDLESEPVIKKRREDVSFPFSLPREEKKKELTSEQIEAAKSRIARPAATSLARQTIVPKKSISTAAQLQRRMEMSRAEKEKMKEVDAAREGSKQQRPLTEGEKIAQLTTGRTNAASVAKGEMRKAHSETQRASTSRLDKPQLRDPTDTKIPMNVRLSFLDKFFIQFLKSATRQMAIENAEIEEKAVKDRTNSKNGYTNAAVNALKKLRDESAIRLNWASNKPRMSHSAVLAGRKINDISVGVKRNINGGIHLSKDEREEKLHSSLEKYVLKEEQLVMNGYPRWETEEKRRVIIESHKLDMKKGKRSFVSDCDLRRQCSRCLIEYMLRKDGKRDKASCTYHYLRAVKKRTRNEGWCTVHACCDGDPSTAGCTIADTHVSDTLRVSDLEAFVESPQPFGECDPRSNKVYAMDCEMVYTTWGPALARVSVVDLNDDLVLDVLVKPAHTLIDANSRFSGLQPEQVLAADNTLEEARQKLFEIVNSQTILIGHSLESDLKTRGNSCVEAMRIVHDRVVDTSVVFPHRSGPPFKRALRTLAGEILMKIIQEDVSGHDSKEDSSACMQLMLHKLKQDGVHL